MSWRRRGWSRCRPTLTDYLLFVRHLLEDNQRQGGVAIKFEIGYFRSLHFDDPAQEATAAAVYAKYRGGGVPTDAEYKDFQDYVFRYLIREAGRCICRCRFTPRSAPETSTASPAARR